MGGQHGISNTNFQSEIPFVPDCHIEGTVSPDVLSSGIIFGSYNGRQYRKFSPLGWQILNASSPAITSANYSAGSDWYYDSETGIYWWPLLCQDDGAFYLAYATDPSGVWTIEKMRRDGGGGFGGARPCLKKFGSTFYIYYWANLKIVCRSCSTPNGIYLDSTFKTCLEPLGGGQIVWDSVSVCEPFVFYKDPYYYLFYMGYNDTLGAVTCFEKTGYATCLTPDGAFSRYPGNPVLSGATGPWDSGNVRAADPVVWNIGSRCFIAVASNAFMFDAPVYTGIFYTDDFVNFYNLSTLNPLLNVGSPGQWDCDGAWRTAPPLLYNGILYFPYQGEHVGATPWLTVGLGIQTINPNWFLWWDGIDSWILSPVLGVTGTCYWKLTSYNFLGTYSPFGTAFGSAVLLSGA
jgi:hypothetical protein